MSSSTGVTVRELADLLGLSVGQVRGLVDRGTIASVNYGYGTKRFVPYEELHRLRALGFTVRSVQSERE
jgi:excisionase family DNA binding protein